MTAISSSDPQAAEKLQSKLKELQNLQEFMKSANKIIRKKLTDEQKVSKLKELGISEDTSYKLLAGDSCQRVGFADYRLQNNNAEIQRIKKRLAELDRKAQSELPKEEEYPELSLTLVRDRSLDRLQLVFVDKPSEEVRSLLKSNGFKWSPTNSAWQRLLNENAELAAKYVIQQLHAL